MAKSGTEGRYYRKREELAARLASSVEMLRGSLVEKFIRCGKPRCACQQGQRHGPLYYLSLNEAGATRLFYIRKDQVAKVKGQIAQFKTYKSIGAAICRINQKLLRLHKKERESSCSAERPSKIGP